MNDDEWVRFCLEQMREDLVEIKQDIKDLKAFRFRMAGGIAALCAILTFTIDVVMMWVK